MLELPLFPLNTVLFPGMPLRLHIFEDRYKKMVKHCLNTGQPFGVVLIKSGQEALDPAVTPHLVGCTARIEQVERLGQGRMNILTVGQERFTVHSLDKSLPYLQGHIELRPLENHSPSALETSAKRLRQWVDRYLNLLSSVSETDFSRHQLPKTPVPLANFAAALIQVDSRQKQALLDAPDAEQFIKSLLQIYRREVTLLRAIVAHERDNGNSPTLPYLN